MTSPIRSFGSLLSKLLGTLVIILGSLVFVAGSAEAAELKFQRAYQGGLSGQTFTTTSLLNADPGSIRFSDGGTQRAFQNTTGTLYYTVGGVPRSETGVLNSRYPNGSVMMDAVAFSGTGGDRLLVLGGSYTTNSAYSGSSNAIVAKLNEYVTATAPDPAASTLKVNGGSSASAIVGQNVSIVATIKLSSGTPISGAIVTLAASPSGGSTISPASATTNANGEAIFTVQGSSPGTVVYSSTSQANGTTTSSGTVSITFTAPLSAANSTATVPAGTAGVATTVTIAVKDTSSNPVPGAAASLAAAIGGTNAGATPSAISDLGAGNYSFTYTPTLGGTDTIAITLEGIAISGSPYQSTVTAPTLVLAPAAGGLPGGTVGTAYSQTLSASGGNAPYTYSATGLPAGLTLDPATGTISGTPTQDGSYTVTVSVTDANGATGTATYTIVIAVQAPSAGAVAATVAANTSGNAITLNLTGGAAASVAVASAPAHGTASVAGLTISYTPAPGYSGSDSFTYTATNASGTSAPATVTITVTAPTLVLAPAAGGLPGGTVGTAYSQTLSASGGNAPYTYSATGLPAGLTLDPATGTISGTPTQDGSYTVTVSVTDANGATGTATYTVVIAPPPAPVAANSASTSMPANTQTAAGQSVNINLASLVSGRFTDISIVTQPRHGRVELRRTLAIHLRGGGVLSFAAAGLSSLTVPGQVVAIYTPDVNFHGGDSFQFVATGPGGSSAPATVSIEVIGTPPVAQPKVANTLDGQAVTVNLTQGATGGPFIAANVVSVSPAENAAVRILPGSGAAAGTFSMEVTPAARFQGPIAITYTLTSAFGVSQPATVSVNVQRRPDPSRDPAVQAISDAQAEASRRFARTQLTNLLQRVESLHSDCRRSANGLRLTATNVGGMSQTSEATSDLSTSGTEKPEGAAPETDEQSCASAVAVWAGGSIDVSTLDAITGRPRISAGSSGITAGIDLRVAKNFNLGVAAGLGHEKARVAGGEGWVNSDASTVAVYGSFAPARGVFIDAALTKGWTSFEIRRAVEQTDTLALGSRDGRFTAGAIKAGFDGLSGTFNWSIYSRADFMRGSLDAYAETASAPWGLRFDRRSLRSTSGVLGFKVGHSSSGASSRTTLSLRGEWLYEFSGGTAQGVDYADIPGAAMYAIQARGWSREQLSLAPAVLLVFPDGWQVDSEVGLRIGTNEFAVASGLQIRKQF